MKVPAVLALATIFITFADAQTITIDISHSVNHIVPSETLGAGVDRIPVAAIDKDLLSPSLQETLSSGWQPVSFRQNTELAVEAWHWNPNGTWSDLAGKGYFTGSATPTQSLRYSYGYALPRRGFTRNDGTENTGYSRLTDGDPRTFWKSNPYLTQHFTGESDALHPQWIVIDLAQIQSVDSVRIAWGEPYATHYVVQYWTGDDPIRSPTRGVWQTFPQGTAVAGTGHTETIRLAATPVPVHFVRIWMTESSNTCDADGPVDPRNCVGYSIRELYLGTTTGAGEFHDTFVTPPTRSRRLRIALPSILGMSHRIAVLHGRLRLALICSSPAELLAGCPP